ncbi:MAG: redox-sensitive transcriptional activator SoxR [Pseudomonadota bacterium]
MRGRVEYLNVGQVAERCGVATSALRFYETKGLIQSVRTAGNQRRYDRAVIRRVAIIKAAQTVGLTLDEIADALQKLPQNKTPTKQDWTRMSRAWREQLDEQIDRMHQLRDKLTGCIGCGCLSMRSCTLFNPADRAAGHGNGPRYLLGNTPSEPVPDLDC